MALPEHKQKAIELRKQGMSYSQIRALIPVAKSTLSNWLDSYPLSRARMRELRDWNQIRIEKYIATRTRQREVIMQNVYEREKEVILPLLKNNLYVSGLFLYWGEGAKTSSSQASVSNTDPAVLKAFIYWMREVFNIRKEQFVVRLHLYKDMSAGNEFGFWSEALGLPLTQFRKPYVKETTLKSLSYKGGFGHGTCNVIVGDVTGMRRIKMGLRVLSEFFGRVA